MLVALGWTGTADVALPEVTIERAGPVFLILANPNIADKRQVLLHQWRLVQAGVTVLPTSFGLACAPSRARRLTEEQGARILEGVERLHGRCQVSLTTTLLPDLMEGTSRGGWLRSRALQIRAEQQQFDWLSSAMKSIARGFDPIETILVQRDQTVRLDALVNLSDARRKLGTVASELRAHGQEIFGPRACALAGPLPALSFAASPDSKAAV